MLSISAHGKGYRPHTLTELKNVPVTPRGKRTQRWVGVQHAELVTTLHSVLHELFDVVPMNEIYQVSPNGANMIGGFELGTSKMFRGKERITPVEPFPGIGTSFGFLHGNDSSRSLRIIAGGRVFLCLNGMVVGDIRFRRRHTKGLFLRDWLSENLETFLSDTTEALQQQVQPLQDTTVDPADHDNYLLELARQNIIPWRMIGDLDTLWTDAARGETLAWVPEADQDKWNFASSRYDYYGAVSHIAKNLSAPQQVKSLGSALNLLMAV